MPHTFPPLLQSGDTIGVMAPSSFVEREDIEKSTALLESRGYKIFIHPQTTARHHQSAGTTTEKVRAFHDLWGNPDIKVIWMAGGGNRALDMIDHLDFDLIQKHPKALIGFSDGTALLNAVTARTGLVTFHGQVFKNLHKYARLEETLNLLQGHPSSMNLQNATILNSGAASGPLVGGCLSLFHLLAGTRDCPDLDGAILFLEDSGDHISRFDRMFLHMKRMGVFDRISALVLGEFPDLQDGARPFGFTLPELVNEYLEERDIPVLINAPFGHGQNLLPLPLGGLAKLNIQTKTLTQTKTLRW